MPESHLVLKKEKYIGELSRNGCDEPGVGYRVASRGRMKGTGIYDNIPQIEGYILKQTSMQDLLQTASPIAFAKEVAERVSKYTFDYLNLDRTPPYRNFVFGDRPYGWQAHHILVCESFYDEMWTGYHLNILLQVEYKINRPENIIYLPQCPKGDKKKDRCHVHNLPDHADSHPRYNEKVLKRVKKVHSKVDEAIGEKNCNKRKDILAEIKKMLEDIESDFYSYLINRGPTSMA